MSTWGWSCCPICGAVIADIDGHIIWHEIAIPEVITDLVDEAVKAALETVKEQPPTTGGETTTRLVATTSGDTQR